LSDRVRHLLKTALAAYHENSQTMKKLPLIFAATVALLATMAGHARLPQSAAINLVRFRQTHSVAKQLPAGFVLPSSDVDLKISSLVAADLDADGDLDIVTNDFNSAPQVLLSDLAARRRIHWTAIMLQGTVSNRDGLGATVRVRAGGQTYMKVHDGKSGYLSQSALPLYFGLGDSDTIERVEVDWPSGKKQVETRNLEVNRVLKIVEPQ
jgi:hypothetical protein